MRRLAGLIACLLLCSMPAWAAVAHVQTSVTKEGSGDNNLTTAAMTVTAGSLLIVSANTWTGAGEFAVSSVQLDGATDFTHDQTAASDAYSRVELWSLANVAGGSHTVTVTWAGGAPYKTVYLTEVSGAATSLPQDGAGATATGSGTSPSTGPFSATGTSFWIVAVGLGGTTFTAGAGWTIPTNGSETDNLGTAIEYQANPGTSPLTGDFTTATGAWGIIGMAYKVAPGAGATGAGGRRMRRPGVI